MRLALAGILVVLGVVHPAAQDFGVQEACYGLEEGLSGMSVRDVHFIRGQCLVTAEKGVYRFDGQRFSKAFVFSDPSQRPSRVFAFEDDFAVVDRGYSIYRADGTPTDFHYMGLIDGQPLCRRIDDERGYACFRDGVASPVRLPAGVRLAATNLRDTLVSDGVEVMRLQAGEAVRLVPDAPRIFGDVRDMIAFEGKIYIACRNGLFVYAPHTGLQPFTDGGVHPWLESLAIFGDKLLGAYAAGITVLTTRGSGAGRGQKIYGSSVYTMTLHEGSLYVGTVFEGLCVLTPERLQLLVEYGGRGALGVALWQDTIRAASHPGNACDATQSAPAPTETGYCYYDGQGVYAMACGLSTVFWDDVGPFARYDAPNMQYIVEDGRHDVYLGASRLVLRIPARSILGRQQAVPDTVRKTKGLTLLKVIGDSLFIGDEDEITLVAGERRRVLAYPAIRDVMRVGEGVLYLGYGTPSRYVRDDGSVSEVTWAHPALAPAYLNAGFHEGPFTYFTSDEGLYYVRSELLTACLARQSVVPLARITLAGKSTIEFNGGFSGSAVKYKGDWYLPAINAVVRMRPLVTVDRVPNWRMTLSGGRDSVVSTIPGIRHPWRSPVVDLGIAWDHLPEVGEFLMQLSVNGDLQYRGGVVRSHQFYLRQGLNRIEVSIFHPMLPGGKQTLIVLVDRRMPFLARVDVWIAFAVIILLAGLGAVAWSRRKYGRIMRAHKGLLKDKAVLLEAWYANPGHHTAPRQDNMLRSYMHDIEGGLKVSADTLKLLAKPGNHSPEMLVEVARGLESLLEISRRTSMEFAPPGHASDAPPQSVRAIINAAVAHNEGYARAKHVRVMVHGNVSLPWKAAPELGRILYVLINNAIKFSMPGSMVEITAELTHKVLNITVVDEGRGFRMQRGIDDAESGVSPNPGTSGEVGSGLGLYLAGRLVDELGGVLSLAPRRHQPGAIATVSLPVD